MTCKDCIHYDVCVIVENSSNDNDYYTEYRCVDFKNKADFAPPSEVAELKEDNARLKDDNEYLQDKVFKVRLEVAREIFEEIEELLYRPFDDMFDEHYQIGERDFDKLKKKYTEDKE